MRAWADKIGANFYVIKERRWPAWPIHYEKLQIYYLAEDNDDDWSLYLDGDALVHPECPDFTELVPPDTVAQTNYDFSPVRWRYDEYFRRDGRHISSANWFAMASAWCRDLWNPSLTGITMDEALERIFPSIPEQLHNVDAAHLIDDYALSRNIARFGLKYKSIKQLVKDWPKANEQYPDGWFFHSYLRTTEEKLNGVDRGGTHLPGIREALDAWGINPHTGSSITKDEKLCLDCELPSCDGIACDKHEN